MIEKLQRIKLREVWVHEAHDFTQWLERNIDVLNDVIDLNLSNAEREKAAGAFSVDLVAEDDMGNTVVIEW
jgi:RecB family endonuclease NucS